MIIAFLLFWLRATCAVLIPSSKIETSFLPSIQNIIFHLIFQYTTNQPFSNEQFIHQIAIFNSNMFIEEISQAQQERTESDQPQTDKNISPESKGLPIHKLFSSPIHVAEFSEQQKNDTESPDLFIEFTNSFKRIVEKENEEGSQNGEMIDFMGNKICEFDSKAYDDQQNVEEAGNSYSPTIDDKQNEIPSNYLKTPLKINRKQARSPLQDITPSMTQKKKKTNSKLTISEKNRFLTPRTIDKSGLHSHSGLRIQRY